jgi:hypothetical protein
VSSAWRNSLIVASIVLTAVTTSAFDSDPEADPKAAYDGRFSFVRIRVGPQPISAYRRLPPWGHDFPRSDFHFMRILQEITFIKPMIDQPNILALDDPDLMKFPIAYLSEPGFWYMTEAEAQGLRNYLKKGGFIIFDDFRTFHNANLFDQMRIVLPDAVWQPLDLTQPIFHSFFEIKSLDVDSYYGRATWLGVFEDNDPHKRLMAVANSNHDLGEYWEFSDTGYFPVDLSNDAYKFGVNYIVYGMTH